MAKYFIDFEASQFKQEIISVGCINDRGEEFQSLVQPSEKKITSFITSLTGITQEMINNANTADVVFADFWDWISEDKEAPCFICYGNCDKTFVQNTLKKVTNLKAKAALLLIESGIKDIIPIIETIISKNLATNVFANIFNFLNNLFCESSCIASTSNGIAISCLSILHPP